MAEERVDGIVITSRFDPSGADQSAQGTLDTLRRFVAEANTLSSSIRDFNIDTRPLRDNLLGTGAEVAEFFSGVAAEVDEGLGRLAAGMGLTADAIQDLRAGFRTGLVEELERFGLSAEEARRTVSRLGNLPTPTLEVGPLLSSGDRLVAGLLPVIQAVDSARARLGVPISVPPIESGRLLASADQTLTALPAVAGRITDTRRLLANPLTVAPIDSTAFRASADRLATDQLRLRAPLETTRRLLARPMPVADVRSVSNEFDRASASANVYARALAAGQAQQEALPQSAAVATQGVQRLRGGLTALAAQASGTSPAIASIVSALLLMGAGSTAVLAAAAGIAVVATAYRFFTKDAREAREENQRLVESLRSRVESARPQSAQIGRQLAAAESERALAAREIEQIELRNLSVLERIVFGKANEIRLRKLNRDVALQQLNLDVGTELFDRAKLEEAERLNAAIRAAVLGRVRDELAAVQAANAIHQQANEQRFQEGLQGLTAYYAQRLGLTREATAAEIQALEAQRRAAQAVPIITEGASAREIAEQRTNRTAEIAHLSRVIELRRQEGELAEQRIRDEQTLSQIRLLVDTSAIAEISLTPKIALKPRIDFSQIEASMKFTGKLLDQTFKDDAFQRMIDGAAGVVDGLDQIAASAGSVGLIGQEADRAIGSVLALGDALIEVGKNASFGNIAGAISSAIGFIGQAFDSGPSERDRILAENTRAIERNTSAREGAFAGLGGQATLASQIGVILAAREAGTALPTVGLPPGLNLEGDVLIAQFRAMGITMGDLERAAERYNIDLTSEGLLTAEALAQLRKEIDADTEAALRFQKTLSDQFQFLDLQARLAGEATDPAARFQREIEALGRIETGIDARFAGLKEGDTEGFRAALQKLLSDLEQGRITPQEAGGLSREDILRLIEDGATAIESLGEAANGATAAMINVPQGFRTAALAFESQIAGFTAASGGNNTGLRPFDRGLVNVRGGDGAALPVLVAAIQKLKPGATTQTFHFNLPRDIQNARQLLEELKRLVEAAEAAGDANVLTGQGR